METNEVIVKRTAKDSVFTHLFQNREYVLQLYLALHPEARGVTEDMIEIVTIENVLIDSIYNDLGFIVDDRLLVLAEAQSTWSANIIVRVLMYLAQTYNDYVRKKGLNLYSSRKVSIPRPEFYMIYTGEKEIERDVISLSEEYFGGGHTDLDVRVHVLTDGKEGDIIFQYVTFTKVLDEQVRLHGRTREAVARTIRICKERDILKKYLSEHEQEVQEIMITLFDNDQILEAFAREKYEDGRVEGRTEGRAEGRLEGAIETARKMLQKAMPADLIAEVCGLPVSEVNALKQRG